MTEPQWTWGALKALNYRLIEADPPWKFRVYEEETSGRRPPYRPMETAAIADLRVADLARSDCLLALWAIDTMLPDAFAVIDAWGFEFKTILFNWPKTVNDPVAVMRDVIAGRKTIDQIFHIGTGYWTRANAELCLLAVRGRPKRLDAGVRRLILSPRRQHSEKPDEAYSRLERLVGGPRCSLFSRKNRPGWDCWGDQVGLLDEVQP